MAQHARSAVSADQTSAVPTNVHDTQGEREDFSDIIGLIAPYDTPCYSTFRKVDAVAPVIHWQQDELAAAVANAVKEGADVASFDSSTPGINLNYTQLLEKTAQVSSTAEATEWYGRASEMDYQVMKRGRELKRDIEFAFVGAAQAKAAGAGGSPPATARQLGGCEDLIHADHLNDEATTILDEAGVLDLHQEIYEAGGDPNWLLVSPFAATVVANFAYVDPTTGTASRQRDMEAGNRLVNIVEIYQGPFGTLTVVTDKFVKGAAAAAAAADGTAFLLETDRWAIPVLQPMQVEDLSKTGHNEKKLISCELSLLHENDKASGAITGHSTA